MTYPAHSKKLHCSIATSLLALSHLAVGQITNTYEWVFTAPDPQPTPAVTGAWDNANNWSAGVVPTTVDDAARITNGQSASILNSNLNIEVGLIFVAGPPGTSLKLDADISVFARQFRIGSGQTGELVQSIGELRMLDQDSDTVLEPEFVIGIEGGGAATFTQTGGVFDTSATRLDNSHPDTRIGAFGANGTYNLKGGSAELYNLRVGFANPASTGTINHSGGTLNHNGELALGWADATGIYNLSGTGGLTTNNRIRVGATAGTQGIFSQSGGTAEIFGGRLELGTEGGAHGTYLMSGGLMTVHDDIFVGAFDDAVPKGTRGEYRQTGGSVITNRVLVGFSPGTFGEIHLNGGTLRTGSIFVRADQPGGAGTLDFDGGTVIATQGGDFIHHFPNVTLNAGGATINTNGQGISIVPPVVGVGGLTKTGAGFVRLAAASSYGGNTVIKEGAIILDHPGGLNPASDVSIGMADSPEGTEFARLELNHTGMDSASHLIHNGVALEPGIYGSAAAAGDHQVVDFITGTGLLKVEPVAVPPGYETWASDPVNGLAAGQRGADFDADADGFDNLLEYFLGGNPTVPSTSITPTYALMGSDFKVTLNRSVISAQDTTGVIEWTSDLSVWPAASQSTVTGTGPITVTVPSTAAMNGKLFVRLKVLRP